MNRQGTMRQVPRLVPVQGGPPPAVEQACHAFSTPLRLGLLRHYLDSPGTQTAAAAALGVSTAVVSHNTKALIALGVVTSTDRGYSVDRAKLDELTDALTTYLG